MSIASLFVCLVALVQPSGLPAAGSSLEVRVLHVCGDSLPGASVVLYHYDATAGLDLSAWRSAGQPQKTDEEGRVLLRSSVAGEFVALAGLAGFTPAFSGPFALSPDAPSEAVHRTEIELESPPSLAISIDPVSDDTDLRNKRLDFECHNASSSRSWRGVAMTGSGFAAIRKAAFCPETGSFVQLSWGHSETGPEPLRTESRTDGRRRELYEFPGCPTPQPALELLGDLKEALGCERLEVTCWGGWD